LIDALVMLCCFCKNFAEGHAANNDSSIKNGLTENRPM